MLVLGEFVFFKFFLLVKFIFFKVIYVVFFVCMFFKKYCIVCVYIYIVYYRRDIYEEFYLGLF